MKYLFSKLLAMTLFVGLSSCSKDDSNSNDSPMLAVNFKTVTAPFDATGKSLSTTSKTGSKGSFLFSDGFISIKSLEYEAKTANDSTSVEFELEGDVMIDFATGVPTPDIRAIVIPAGTYEEVEIEVELSDETAEPAIVINGAYTAVDGEVHPLRFEFNTSDDSFEVEREGAIVITEGQSAIAEITFDPSAWFAGVTDEIMAGANKNSDDVIVISETQNSAIFDIVSEGLEVATDLEFSN